MAYGNAPLAKNKLPYFVPKTPGYTLFFQLPNIITAVVYYCCTVCENVFSPRLIEFSVHDTTKNKIEE